MRNFYFLSNLCKTITRSCSVVAILLTVGVGNVWGQATLPSSFDDKKGNLPTGYTHSGLGDNYSSSPYLKFDTSNDFLNIFVASAPAYISFVFKQNGSDAGTFKVQESADDKTYTDALTVTWPGNTKTTTVTANLLSSTRYVKLLYVTKISTTNVAVGSINIKARTTVTLDKNGGSADGSAVVAYNATAKESLSAPTYAGHAVTGYWDAASSGNKVLNADGSFASSSVSGWITSSKWSKDAATAKLYARWEEICSNSVTINKGTGTNCTFTLSKSGSQASCDGVSTTVTVSPTSGYGSPSVTESGASAAPMITGSSNTYTVAYAANTTGTSTINVSCSANNYTINLNTDLTPTSAGTTSITATYNASTNLTSAITKPTKTGWTFGGYYTAKNGGGTQIIDASGNVIASVSGYTDASKNWKYAGNITLYAKWTCTVTWSVSGATNVYSTQTVTYNASGSKVASIPGPPSPASYCGDKFMGWTTESSVSQDDDTGLGLFTTVLGSPDIKSIGDITFYAVFADYDE